MAYEDRMRREDYTVRTVPLAVCQRLVALHHYAQGGANTATFRHGLFHKDRPDDCLGIAWWIPPTRSAAEARYPTNWRHVLTLSRLVIVPDVPKNAATFLLMRSVALIRQDGRFVCLLTYADEWQGHRGTIYRAANWTYMGLTTPESTWVDPAGRMVARKAGPKTRTIAEMEELGYHAIGRFRKHCFMLLIEPKPIQKSLFAE